MADENTNITKICYGIDQTNPGVSNKVVSSNPEYDNILEGNHYFVASFETLGADASAKFSVTVPNADVFVHMMFTVEATTRTEFYVYEGATITAGTGTSVTPLNNNRNSAKLSVCTLAKNPTITAGGTLIFAQSSGLEGVNPSRATNEGLVERERELILKKNTTYIFELKSKVVDNIISYVGEWYEV